MSIHQQHKSVRASAFTIIEMMVTLGIVILIAAGVSVVFTSISKTVNDGTRIAEINRFNAQLERIMRRDIENITRDGFMVIVHQYAPGDEPANAWDDRDVQLSPADRTDEDDNGDFGRPRRIDEIMFFSRAEYETARRAVTSGMIAKSSEAAIYYGHGQRRRPNLTGNIESSNNKFFNPSVDDTNIDFRAGINQAGLGIASTDGILNPNQYAADWTLLRQVTLLAQPQTSGQDLPDELFNVQRIGPDRPWLEDSDRQVALQPALRTLFSSLNTTLTAPVLPRWFRDYPSTFIPLDGYEVFRASGLVDIATTDISSVATIVRFGPGAGSWLGSPLDYASFNQFQIALDADIPAQPEIRPADWSMPTSAIAQQRLWMLDALPSLWDLATLSPLSRVRYETVPTRLLYEEDAFANDRERVYTESDQEMLGSSSFIPRCTEFIVEWSYGLIDKSITDPFNPNYKRMRWYGLPRAHDDNDDDVLQPGELYADRYFARDTTGLTDEEIAREKWVSQLVMGHDEGTQFDTEISMFGFEYTNPESVFSDDPIQPWPWPKYIRVTISIADAQDLTLERSFQMVFEIPDASNN